MSGVTLQVEFDDADVRRLIDRLSRRFRNLQPVMAAIGEDVREGVRDAFMLEEDPTTGRPWKTSKRAETGKKGKRGKTLQKTRTLYNSITVEAGRDWVAVGTPVEYAAVHQFGADRRDFGQKWVSVKGHNRRLGKGKKGRNVWVAPHVRSTVLPWGDIPARPFIGLSAHTRNQVLDTLINAITEGI